MNPSDPLLIALLPLPVDLDRARAGWYRVPLERSPPTLARARALAFYQPASFEEARWQVAWWAPLLQLEQLRRRELLPEEAGHPRADDWYVVARLGPVQPVDPPKRASRGRRILFVPTTWGAFLRATTLDDLFPPLQRPIADDPLFDIIRQQVEGKSGIPDPGDTHQKRLFEGEDAGYNPLDW